MTLYAQIVEQTGEIYIGTAGVMFDFSPADGLKSVLSSFSKMVFSDDTIRRVAMFTMNVPGLN